MIQRIMEMMADENMTLEQKLEVITACQLIVMNAIEQRKAEEGGV